MRIAILFIALCLNYLSLAQEWRDSLEFARSSYRKGDYATAMRYYESAQKKAPDHVDLSDEHAQSAYRARQFERSEEIYQQSSASKKTSKKKSDSFHNLGNARMKKKDYSGAIEAYKESLRNDPSNQETRYNLSEAIRKQREEQKKQDQNKDKNKDQDQKDQCKNPGDNKDQNNPQNKEGNNSGNKSKDQNPSKDDQQGGKKNANLPNKSVERMLDELMKAESATKRKIGGQKGSGTANRSGKDW